MKKFFKCEDCYSLYRKLVHKCNECGSKDIKPIEIEVQKQTIREL